MNTFQDTIRAYDTIEGYVTKIKWAYLSYESNTRHQRYYVKLQSGKYLSTIRLIDDIKKLYPNAEITKTWNHNKHYVITVDGKPVDYIIYIGLKNRYIEINE